MPNLLTFEAFTLIAAGIASIEALILFPIFIILPKWETK